MTHQKAFVRRSVFVLFAAYLLLTKLAMGQEWRLSPTATKNAPSKEKTPYLVVVSIDGFRHDYIKKYKSRNLARLAKNGVMAESLLPCFPSKTFPNHYSIATGLYPDHHGLVSNGFYHPGFKEKFSMRPPAVREGKWYGGKPIWVLAEENGLRSGSFFWVGSEAEILGKRPSEYYQYQHNLPNEYRVEQVVNWLKRPHETRPHLILLYFSLVDDAGHTFGPSSKKVEQAVKKVDRLIGSLYKQISQLDLPINLMVVSDHGMQEADIENPVNLDSITDLSKANLSFSSTFTMIYEPFDQLAEVYYKDFSDALLRPEYKGKYQVYLKDDLPDSLNFGSHKAVGDIVLFTNPPYVFSKGTWEPKSLGEHGYEPTLNSMGSLFIGIGPNFKKGITLPPVENIHLYPLMTEILQVPLPKIDGKLSQVKDALLKPEDD